MSQWQLMLHPYVHGTNAPAPRGYQAIVFEVRGLPRGEEAWIAQLDLRWKVLRARAGIHTDWEGDYATEQHALTALQMVINREQGSQAQKVWRALT